MQTRREQLQAYRFVTRRVATSLTSADPDSAELPLRRMNVAVLGSLMVAVLVVAGVGIYGALNPGGSTSWRAAGVLVLEQESSTRYVYLGGVLHPVLNDASGRLVLRTDPPKVVTVSRASLAGVPRGLPVGIPGAPDELPAPSALAGLPWVVCSEPVLAVTGRPATSVRLTPGGGPPGLRPVADDHALLVESGDGTDQLIWHGKRLRLAGPGARAALGYDPVAPLVVGDGWLNAVPAGADLAAPDVPDRARPGPQVGGTATRAGQVLAVTGIGDRRQFYLVRTGGLQAVTPVDAALLLGSPATQQAYPGTQVAAVAVPAAAVAATPVTPIAPATAVDHPTDPPPPADAPAASTAACATYTDPDATATTISLRTTTPGPQTPGPQTPAATAVDPATGGPIADHVDVPPGTGQLVRARPGPDVNTGTRYLVTDLGEKYPIADTAAQDALGYRGVAPVPIPVSLLQLVPTGPALDTTAAARTVPVLAPAR